MLLRLRDILSVPRLFAEPHGFVIAVSSRCLERHSNASVGDLRSLRVIDDFAERSRQLFSAKRAGCGRG